MLACPPARFFTAVRQALLVLAFSLPPSGKLCFACLTAVKKASFAGSLNIRVLRDPGNKKKGRQKAHVLHIKKAKALPRRDLFFYNSFEC